MKIKIKDIFEKEGGPVAHTNSRLDVHEVFAEALSADAKEADEAQAISEPEVNESESGTETEEPGSSQDQQGNEPESESRQLPESEPDLQEDEKTEEDDGTESLDESEPEETASGDVENIERAEAEAETIEAEAIESKAIGSEAEKIDAAEEDVEANQEASGIVDKSEVDEAKSEAAETESESDEAKSEAAETGSESDEAELVSNEAELESNEAAEGAETEEKEAPEEPETPDEESVAENIVSEDASVENHKARRFAFSKEYGWPAGITAAFIAIILLVIVYTTMIPREVNATINGEEFEFSSKAHTVEGFLEEENIAFCKDDYISMPLETFIYDGIELEINHATDFTVTADGKTKKFKSLENTVGDALKDVNVKVGEKDIVNPGVDTLLAKNMKIVIQRVVVKEEAVEEEVPFKTVNKDDSSLDEGTRKVVTEGVNGKDKVTYEITYIDGKEASRKEIARETVTAAVDKVVANGTRISFNGQSYSRKLVVKAYAYTGGGRTAMGTRARVGEIAVDPSVIPLGSTVYIEGVGARRAEDTGGNIKGNTIDIYMDTQSQCINWGARYVTIYIQ